MRMRRYGMLLQHSARCRVSPEKSMINTRLNALGRAQRLQIYPNPAADFLMVNLGGIHAAVMLSVVDVLSLIHI